MEYTLGKFDGLLSQIKTLISSLNPIEGITAELFKQGVLSPEERERVERAHREQRERDERAREEEAGRILIEIVEQKRNLKTLRGLVAAQIAFQSLYEQVQLQSKGASPEENSKLIQSDPTSITEELDDLKEFDETSEQQLLDAFQHGHLRIKELKVLLEACSKDSDVREITNFEGKSLLHLACCSMLINMVILLIDKYHFNPSVKDSDGNTPLHDACRCRKVEIVSFLVNHPSCDPNIQNEKGNTPLHESTFLRHWGVCRALLSSARVDYAVKNNDGVSIFGWLEEHPEYSKEMTRLKRILFAKSSTVAQSDDRKGDGGISSPHHSLARSQKKGILRTSAVNIEMEPMIKVDDDTAKSHKISVEQCDAIINVVVHAGIFGCGLLVAIAIIAAIIYLLITMT